MQRTSTVLPARGKLPGMTWLNVYFEVVGAGLVTAALFGWPIGRAVGWSAVWAVESIGYYLSVGDTASAVVASVRACACFCYWVKTRVYE